MNEYLELLDWRRRVAELWAAWRAAAPRDPAAATQAFRAARDRLFREHPQSPLSAAGRRGFAGLVHWAYDEDWRLSARLERDAGVPGPHADAPALAQLP
ncbi:MAG TPA: hypothetical protein VFK38_07620, partial [Candidatus Limnocylindrales bacterium]|nr:hypothetical protein [Candidatus Limnocylindrales bacterium]